MTEFIPSSSLDGFLYDRNLRHESVNIWRDELVSRQLS